MFISPAGSGSKKFNKTHHDVLRAHHTILENYPIAAPSLLLVVELAMADPQEVVIAGEPSDR